MSIVHRNSSIIFLGSAIPTFKKSYSMSTYVEWIKMSQMWHTNCCWTSKHLELSYCVFGEAYVPSESRRNLVLKSFQPSLKGLALFKSESRLEIARVSPLHKLQELQQLLTPDRINSFVLGFQELRIECHVIKARVVLQLRETGLGDMCWACRVAKSVRWIPIELCIVQDIGEYLIGAEGIITNQPQVRTSFHRGSA